MSREPTVFRMKTHAFGLTSSPSCANYALKQLASDYSDEYKDASEFLSNSLYIDDCLISLNSDQQALKLINGAVELCKKGGLTLHKFLSNSSYVMQYVHENYIISAVSAVSAVFDFITTPDFIDTSTCPSNKVNFN